MLEDKYIRGRQAAIDGFAHQHIVAGILMKRYWNVSLVDLPLSTYDIVIVLKDPKNLIRAAVKTVAKYRLSFEAGGRGGVERKTISNVKKYTHSTKTADVLVGVKPAGTTTVDLYFVPTILIEALKQKSISLRKIEHLKNNYKMLENCKKQKRIVSKCRAFGILS